LTHRNTAFCKYYIKLLSVQKAQSYDKIEMVIKMDINEIVTALQTNANFVLAIDGPSGSGKSTLSQFLEEQYHCLVFHTDDYFLHPSRKTNERLNEPGGYVDYERIIEEIFQNINNQFIPSNHFNCQTNELENRPSRKRKNIIIIEGVYSMHPMFLPYYDATIFLNINRQNQYDRILKRSNNHMLERFKQEWIPLEDLYFKHFDVKNVADVVLESSINLREIFVPFVL